MGAIKKFAFFEHTADVVFEAYGSSFKQCVENSASALFNVMAKPRFLKSSRRKVFREKAGSREELLVFLLNDLLSESDASEVFWKDFKVRKLVEKNGFSIEGVASGSAVTRKAAGDSVKGVTLHEASVTAPTAKVGKASNAKRCVGNKGGTWVARILLDV